MNPLDPLDLIMGTKEASERWGLSQHRVKMLCAAGAVTARLFGKTWIIPKEHPNPKQVKQAR